MKIRVKKRKGNLDNEHNKPPPTPTPQKKKVGESSYMRKARMGGDREILDY